MGCCKPGTADIGKGREEKRVLGSHIGTPCFFMHSFPRSEDCPGLQKLSMCLPACLCMGGWPKYAKRDRERQSENNFVFYVWKESWRVILAYSSL